MNCNNSNIDNSMTLEVICLYCLLNKALENNKYCQVRLQTLEKLFENSESACFKIFEIRKCYVCKRLNMKNTSWIGKDWSIAVSNSPWLCNFSYLYITYIYCFVFRSVSGIWNRYSLHMWEKLLANKSSNPSWRIYFCTRRPRSEII